MTSNDEFNKPLRGVAEREQPDTKRGWIVAACIVALFALPVFQFYGGLSLILPEERTVVAGLPQEIALEPVKQPAVSNETTAAIPEEKPEPVVDDNGFQRIESGGALILSKPEPVIVPRPQPKIQRQQLALAHLPDPQLIERGAGGVIPKISSDGLRAMDVYSRQPETEGNFGVARVVIVIGGMGISQTSTQQAIESLPSGVTLAFAPYGNSLTRWMQKARKKGHELLLQVPMEPIDYPKNNPGPHTLIAAADLQENLANLHWSMSRITNYVGVTNYLGNKLLQQPAGLSPIFGELSKRGLLFFDDGTVKNSTAEGVAVKELVPFAKADILIDNIRSRQAIADKLNQLAEQAKRTGLAIGMANAFPDTIDIVAQFAQRARENGLEITPISAIVRDPRK